MSETSIPVRVLPMAVAVLLLWSVSGRGEAGRVSATKHNLAARGLGARSGRAAGELCGFCHSPHRAEGMQALWARTRSPGNYRIYESSTLDAKPGQPTGSSKMCLSCHDGTIAMGHVSPGRRGGGPRMPAAARANLGMDLSDDHPISFAYTPELAAQDAQLADPFGLPPETPLDKEQNMQCITCHNPHDNRWGKFLTKSDRGGELCVICHRLDGWNEGSHTVSPAATASSSGEEWPYGTVSQNACRSCHRPHSAKGHERLLIAETEETNCLVCHNGGVARTDIEAEIRKPSAHDPRRYFGEHDPAESRPVSRMHVECSDCHNPHAAMAEKSGFRGYKPIGATLSRVKGVSVSGATLERARNEYEVCFNCHGDALAGQETPVVRQVQTTGLRAEFSPGSESYHPVIAGLVQSDTVSLEPFISKGTRIRCTDCHNSESSPRAGGNGPDGPHGSIYDHLLVRNYSTADGSSESEYNYALCYGCHRRSSILADESFPQHKKHVVDQKTPCSVCHDPHGVPETSGSDHAHLINFDTAVVYESTDASGSPERAFRQLGLRAGSCTLLCHGSDHQRRAYGR